MNTELNFNYKKLLFSEILSEDIAQEAELLKLEGKVPHRGIIEKRLFNDVPELLFDFWIPSSAKVVNTSKLILSTDDYTRLVEYLYSTSIDIDIIGNFLDNPNDKETLKILVTALKKGKYMSAEQWSNTLPKPKSIRVLLLEKIKLEKEITIEFLLIYIYSMHTSKRPKEAVRISLNRLIQDKQIKEKNGKYSPLND